MIDLTQLSLLFSRKYYVDQGILEPLDDWFEQDAEITLEAYFEKVWEANKLNGKLYNFVPLFTVNTKMTSKDFKSDMDEKGMTDLFETYHAKALFGGAYSRDLFLYEYMVYNLESGNNLPGEDELSAVYQAALGLNAEKDPEYDEVIEILTSRQKLLSIGDGPGSGLLRNLDNIRVGNAFFDGIFFVGFPGNHKNYSSIVNLLSIGMCANSIKKELSWDFFKYLLSDEFQEGDHQFGNLTLPVKKKIFLEDLTKNQFIYGIASGEGDQVWDLKIQIADEKTVETVLDLFETTSLIYEVDPALYQIVTEEGNRYFSGTITSDDAAKNAITRMKLYISENENLK